MHEAVVATDEAFNIIFMNETAEKLLGAKVTGRAKMPLKDYLTHSSLAAFDSAFKDHDSHAASLTIEQLDIRGGSKSTPVRLTSTVLKLSDFEAHVMVLADISAELHTRAIIEHEVAVRTRELHQAQAYLLSSINSLEQGFVLVDDGCKIRLANGVAAQLLGADSVSLEHAPLDRATQHLHWNANLTKAVAQVLERRHGRQLHVATSDGSFFTVFITPIVDGEQLLGATVVIQDVTEAKILERSRDEFFSIASHELRTPLTAIRGNMSMVRDYFPEAMKDASLAAMVDDTHAASVRLIEIVNDFLDMSKLEQGKLEFTIQPVPVEPPADKYSA